MRLIADYDIIVDGCDNFPTRYLVNDACVFMNKPNVHGSIFQFEGQATVFYPRKGPCYRCLFPEPPPPGAAPSCAEAGVLGVLPGLVGCVQALETIKLILGVGQAADRPPAPLRHAGDGGQQLQAAQGSGVPGVRRAPDRHRADRLRGVLRPPGRPRRACGSRGSALHRPRCSSPSPGGDASYSSVTARRSGIAIGV